MKKVIIYSVISLMIGISSFVSNNTNAQVKQGVISQSFKLNSEDYHAIRVQNQGLVPPSFKINPITQDYQIIELQKPDLSDILNKDEEDGRNGIVRKIGKSIFTNLNLENSGTWTDLPDGGKIWRLKIKSEDALALGVYFDKFYLPLQGKLWLYNEAKTHIVGPFTYEDNSESGLFASGLVQGESVTFEYYEPSHITGKAIINISEIGYFFRDVSFTYNKEFGDAASCEVNINCSPAGTNWQDEKRGVARILLKAGAYYGWCTGGLVNNTNQDCTPYFLTAWHCGEGASASDFTQWVFYFNYEAPTCTNPGSEPSSNTSIGCTKKAEYQISGGSDFLLLLLSQTIPQSYNVYYNGWNRGTQTSTGAMIHHPMGDIKKISYYNYIQSCTPNISGDVMATNAGWCMTWGATGNGTGVTEVGSSGSPLFDNTGKIIGTLTGGSSTCSNPTAGDACGKFSYHWASNGSTNATKLQPWLDPAGTNPTTLNGMNYCGSNNPPVAAFTWTPTSPVVNTSVQFTDQSTNIPTSWAWTFGDGGTSATQNPTHTYTTIGAKNVCLTATNSYGTSPQTCHSVTVVATPPAGCDTVLPASFASGTCALAIYYIDVTPFDSGFISGSNAWLDKEKAMLYTGVANGTVSDVYVMYGLKAGTTGNTSVKIYSSNAGAPGTLLGTSATIVKSAIDTTNQGINYNNKYHFASPISVGSDFFVSVVLPATWANGTNELAIWGETYTCSSTSSLAYEMWSDNAWHDFTTVYGTNIDMAIFPDICTTVGENDMITDNNVFIFPNPASNAFTIDFSGNQQKDVTVNVYNMIGKLVKSISLNSITDKMFIDMSSETTGIYIVNIKTSQGTIIKKLSLIK